jgi:hypothetical protein
MDLDLWTYPLPEIVGEPSYVSNDGQVFVPISEVMKQGKLVSKVPQIVRSCVAQVAGKSGGDVSKGFAICTAALQKSGTLKKGTQKLTKSGRGKAGARGKDPDSKNKDLNYERLVAAARKG